MFLRLMTLTFRVQNKLFPGLIVKHLNISLSSMAILAASVFEISCGKTTDWQTVKALPLQLSQFYTHTRIQPFYLPFSRGAWATGHSFILQWNLWNFFTLGCQFWNHYQHKRSTANKDVLLYYSSLVDTACLQAAECYCKLYNLSWAFSLDNTICTSLPLQTQLQPSNTSIKSMQQQRQCSRIYLVHLVQILDQIQDH